MSPEEKRTYEKMYLVFESIVLFEINKEKLEIEERAITEIKSHIITLRNYLRTFKFYARCIIKAQPEFLYQEDGSFILHRDIRYSIWFEAVSRMDMYTEFLVDVLPYLEPNLLIHESCRYTGSDYYKSRIEAHPDYCLVREYFNEQTSKRRKSQIVELIDEMKREVHRKQQHIVDFISSTKKKRQLLIFRELPQIKQGIEHFFSLLNRDDETHYHEYNDQQTPYSIISKTDMDFLMND